MRNMHPRSVYVTKSNLVNVQMFLCPPVSYPPLSAAISGIFSSEFLRWEWRLSIPLKFVKRYTTACNP